jgi:BMFP domain-containing protein YqiC
MAAPRILDDLAKTATGAVGVLQSARQEVEALARARLERLLDKMELVTREEFEAVKEMAAKARAENEALAARIAALEAAVASKPVETSKTKRRRPTSLSRSRERDRG